jgi:hypothetical protein
LVQVSEWKRALTLGLLFFIASRALAPALTTQRTPAAEINSKLLKMAAAIKTAER